MAHHLAALIQLFDVVVEENVGKLKMRLGATDIEGCKTYFNSIGVCLLELSHNLRSAHLTIFERDAEIRKLTR